jgi:4-amino-4-deoxy-L-arabinose transferase-like glycosyltransferase
VATAIQWIVSLPERQFWLLVIGTALLPRLVVALVSSYQPIGDALWYHATAWGLAVGRGFAFGGKFGEQLTAYRPPGYPFLLGLTYRLFGPEYNLAWLWGILFTAIIILTTYYIARRLYGTAVARLATLALAAYPVLVLLIGQVMSDLAFLAGLMLLMSFVLSRPSYCLWHAIVIGVALGLLTLTRGVAIGLFCVIPLIWLLRRVQVRRLVVALIVLLVAFVVTLTPWVLRNYSVFGRLTLGTNFGINAYIGNHPGASGGYGFGDLSFVPPYLDESGLDSVMLNQAVQFVISHPIETLSLIPKKLMHLYLTETSAVDPVFQDFRIYSKWMKYGVYGITQVSYMLVLLLFCFRMLDLFDAASRPRGIQWTGWILALYFTLLSLIFFGADRFRLPILPWMLIEVSVFVSRMVGPLAKSKIT